MVSSSNNIENVKIQYNFYMCGSLKSNSKWNLKKLFKNWDNWVSCQYRNISWWHFIDIDIYV
jgi:hypothetical protein